MRFSYDFHIHSMLSPCAEDEMTPNNIINMATMNKLDIIAVTDHNSAKNVPAFLRCAIGKPVVFVPGIEAESAEEVHISCLFPNAEAALEMGEVLNQHLLSPENSEEIFGQQLIADENDNVIGKEKKMLLYPTSLTSKEVFDTAWECGGVAYFSHVDRASYGVLSVLGVFPENINSGIAEVSDNSYGREFGTKRQELCGKTILYCSDAHRLCDISHGTNYLEIPLEHGELSASVVVEWLRNMSRG